MLVLFLLHSPTVSADETALGMVVELTEAKLLELIESAYPNPVTVEELATQHGWNTDAVAEAITTLQEKGLIHALEHGAFTRSGRADSHVQVCFLYFTGTGGPLTSGCPKISLEFSN
jgi:predicted transcriptional regulator